MLDNFKLYRKFRGGIWVKFYNKRIDGSPLEYWKRYHPVETEELACELIQNEGNVKIIKYEAYISDFNQGNPIQFLIGLTDDLSVSMLSDGYHSFMDLYDHRNTLFVTLLNMMSNGEFDVWKSLYNSVGQSCEEGYFIAGIGSSITYHLPSYLWDDLLVPEISESKWDGHTADEVIKELENLSKGSYRTYIEKLPSPKTKVFFYRDHIMVNGKRNGIFIRRKGDIIYYREHGDGPDIKERSAHVDSVEILPF